MLGRTAALQRAVALRRQRPAKLTHQPRFADAGLTVQQQGLAAAGHRALPALQQLRQLVVAADKGRQIAALVEAFGTQRGPLVQHAKHRAAVLEALEQQGRLEGLEGKALAGDAPGGRTGQHAARHGGRLQPCRVVHRRAHRLAVADHHPTGGHADAHLQPEIDKGLAQCQRSAQRQGNRVFAGQRMAEIAHQAVVALWVIGQPGMGAGNAGHAQVVLAEPLAVLLVAKPVHLAGGVNQIAAEDADLAHIVGRRCGQRGHRAAMPGGSAMQPGRAAWGGRVAGSGTRQPCRRGGGQTPVQGGGQRLTRWFGQQWQHQGWPAGTPGRRRRLPGRGIVLVAVEQQQWRRCIGCAALRCCLACGQRQAVAEQLARNPPTLVERPILHHRQLPGHGGQRFVQPQLQGAQLRCQQRLLHGRRQQGLRQRPTKRSRAGGAVPGAVDPGLQPRSGQLERLPQRQPGLVRDHKDQAVAAIQHDAELQQRRHWRRALPGCADGRVAHLWCLALSRTLGRRCPALRPG